LSLQIEQVGTKYDIVNHPNTEFVRQLIRAPQQQIKDFAGHIE